MISIIVAVAHNNVIGKSNAMPWYLPADLRHFKEVTTGHAVIMGRRTFESIMAYLGKPLPGRQNIVITRDHHFRALPDVIVAHSLAEAISAASGLEIFIIGGAQIYSQAIPLADRIYLTEVDAAIDGDTFFPAISDDWKETARESHQKDDKNPYDYSFVTLTR